MPCSSRHRRELACTSGASTDAQPHFCAWPTPRAPPHVLCAAHSLCTAALLLQKPVPLRSHAGRKPDFSSAFLLRITYEGQPAPPSFVPTNFAGI